MNKNLLYQQDKVSIPSKTFFGIHYPKYLHHIPDIPIFIHK